MMIHEGAQRDTKQCALRENSCFYVDNYFSVLALQIHGRTRLLDQWIDLLDLGVPLATGTDSSVSPYNPFYTLHAAVTRQDRSNNPPGGWIPEQAMTREEALRAATMGGAYAMRAEDTLGSIEVGKLADFVVIPVDYMTIPAEDIWRIKPEMTVIGGEVVYTRPVPVGD